MGISLRGELTDQAKAKSDYSFSNNKMVNAIIEILKVND